MAQKEDCIFCKIANGQLPAAKIYEDEKHLAFLDGMPNMKGQTLVITKDHYDSYLFDMPNSAYEELLKIVNKAAKMLEKGLDVNRVGLIFEGMGVNHIHAKLYPMHGVEKDFSPNVPDDEVFFDEYPGYLTTIGGPKVEQEEREKIAKDIREKNKDRNN